MTLLYYMRVSAFPSDELYGRPIETESPGGISTLISRLATTLPGIRLGEKLNACGANSHQQIADVLGADGMSLMYHASNVVVLIIVPGKLTHRTLDIFRTSEIAYLDLSSSLGDQDGLNLDAQALFHGTVDALRILAHILTLTLYQSSRRRIVFYSSPKLTSPDRS